MAPRLIPSIVAAVDADRGIGLHGDIPWKCPEDMRFFRDLTMGHAVIVGRLTYESLPTTLPGRTLIVVTSSPVALPPGVRAAKSLEAAVSEAEGGGFEHAFVAGGERLYEEAMATAVQAFITRMPGSHGCDRFLPAFGAGWTVRNVRHGRTEGVTFERWNR